jgi:ankyrin repeat protein
LLDAGVDINARDQHGQTSLMIAARHGQAEVIRLLVTRGAALDHSAKYRLTALMLAVIGGHSEIVRVLVNAGANTAVRGSGAPGFHERTASDLAKAAGRGDVEELLRHNHS